MDPPLLLKLPIPRPTGAKGQDQKGEQAMRLAAECSSFPKGLRWPPAPQTPAFPPLLHPVVPLPILGRTCQALAATSPAWCPVAARALGTALCSPTARSVRLRRPTWGASLLLHQRPCQQGGAGGRAAALSVPLDGRLLGTWGVPWPKRRMERMKVHRGVEGEGSGAKCLLLLLEPLPASWILTT